MIVLLAVGITLMAVVVGTHGWDGLRRLTQICLHGESYAAGAALSQLVSIYTNTYHLVWLTVTVVCLARFCWLNRRRRGIILIALGVGLNLLAMSANSGTMPVAPQALQRIAPDEDPYSITFRWSKGDVLADSDARVAWLGDRFVLPGPLAPLAIWSIGDACLLAGVGLLLWHALRREQVYAKRIHFS